jgi:hypothetical protein
MNINQALRRIKVLKGQVSAWETRASISNVVGQDETPTYKFEECISNRAAALAELIDTEARVAVANANNKVRGISLCEAIRRLQNFKAEIAWLRVLPDLPVSEVVEKRDARAWDASVKEYIYVKEDYKKTCTMDARAVQRKVDALQTEFDALNSEVEAANHSVEI